MIEDLISHSDAEDRIQREQTARLVRRMLAGIPSRRNREIVERYFGIGGQQSRTLREVGAEFGLSCGRTQQIVSRSILRALWGFGGPRGVARTLWQEIPGRPRGSDFYYPGGGS